MKSRFPVCVVTWEDSVSNDDWDPISEHGEVHTITSCGFLIRTEKKCITLALNIDQSPDDENLFSQTITIPRVNVVSVKKLGVLRGRQREE